MRIPEPLTCLLRNLISVKKQQLEPYMEKLTGWKLGKECDSAYFYAEYLMRKAGLHESQDRIKIAGRNTENLRCADNTAVMAEVIGNLKCLLMRMNETGKAGLKLNIQKTKIKASSPITLWQIKGDRFYFLGLQNHCEQWLQP